MLHLPRAHGDPLEYAYHVSASSLSTLEAAPSVRETNTCVIIPFGPVSLSPSDIKPKSPPGPIRRPEHSPFTTPRARIRKQQNLEALSGRDGGSLDSFSSSLDSSRDQWVQPFCPGPLLSCLCAGGASGEGRRWRRQQRGSAADGELEAMHRRDD